MADPLNLQPDNINDGNTRFAFDQVRIWSEGIMNFLSGITDESNVDVKYVDDDISSPGVNQMTEITVGNLGIQARFDYDLNAAGGGGGFPIIPTVQDHAAPDTIIFLGGSFYNFAFGTPTSGILPITFNSTVRFSSQNVGTTNFRVGNFNTTSAVRYNLFLVYRIR